MFVCPSVVAACRPASASAASGHLSWPRGAGGAAGTGGGGGGGGGGNEKKLQGTKAQRKLLHADSPANDSGACDEVPGQWSGCCATQRTGLGGALVQNVALLRDVLSIVPLVCLLLVACSFSSTSYVIPFHPDDDGNGEADANNDGGESEDEVEDLSAAFSATLAANGERGGAAGDCFGSFFVGVQSRGAARGQGGDTAEV